MSKKYIDADELLNRISKLECESPNPKYAQAINDALQGYFPQIINDTPAADVVEVVRCKDCKHISDCKDMAGYFKCRLTGAYMSDNDYCSCGTRKENG